MKEFIFVDGVNVRKLIDDLGYLILLNISKMPIPIHEICNAVELSNYSFVYSRLKFDEKNGCDCENYIGTTCIADFYKSKFGRDGPYLFIGRLTKAKGLRILLKAWRKYKSSGGRKQLIVCGPFNPNHNFDELKDNNFLKCYDIKYIGAVNDVWQYLEDIYALIIPSLREGHSNVMLEAMAWGIPVIASNIPGLKEDLSESGAGVLFQSGEVNEVLNKMQEFDEDTYDLEKMSENGQKFIRNIRTITHTVESFYRIIKEIKKNKRGVQ